jgi:site-specific DNA recombinase
VTAALADQAPPRIFVMPGIEISNLATLPAAVIRPAIYARVSKKNKSGETVSVDRQVEVLLDICEKKGWPKPALYLDKAISASEYSTKPRPEYERLLRDIAAGLVTAVLFWAVDRLVRRTAELDPFMALAEQYGVHLIEQEGTYDLENPSDRFMLRMKGAVAAWESDHKSQRLTLAAADNARRGKSGGGTRPYGFKAPHYIEHDPDEAEVIREMVARVLEGASTSSIARDLNKRGIKAARGGLWSGATVKNCLLTPRIAGYRLHIPQKERTKLSLVGKSSVLTHESFQRRELFEAKWKKIVDLDTWRAVRKILVDPTRQAHKVSAVDHLLSGIIRCENCHSKLVPKKSKRAATRYVCVARLAATSLSKIPDADVETCGGRGIQEDVADEYVTLRFLAYITRAANFARIKALQAGASGPVVEELASAISDDEELLNELGEQIAQGLSKRVYVAAAAKIEARLASNRRALERVRPALNDEIPVFGDVQKLIAWWNDDSIRASKKRSVLRWAVSHVDLAEASGKRLDTGRLTIRFHDLEGN